MNVPDQIVILMMLSFNSDFFYSLELIKIGQYTKKKKKNSKKIHFCVQDRCCKCKTKRHKPPRSSICHTFCFLLKWHMLLDI